VAQFRAAREDRCLVADVGEVGAGEACGLARDHLEVDIGRHRLSSRVHLEDRLAAGEVGRSDEHLPVEPAGTKERRVEILEPVRRADDDDAVRAAEAVQLDEELVQGLVVLAVEARARAAHPDRVELVDEDDRGRVLARLVEELADSGGAETGEHLDESRRALRVEGRPRGMRDGLGEQRLSGPWRPVDEDALRDACAEDGEALRILEEVDDLLELGGGLVDTGDVFPADSRLRVGLDLRRLHPRHEREHAPKEIDEQPEEDQGQPGEQLVLEVAQKVGDHLHPDPHRREGRKP
jgi:hypothetical protein